jgi:hypothetical protein
MPSRLAETVTPGDRQAEREGKSQFEERAIAVQSMDNAG